MRERFDRYGLTAKLCFKDMLKPCGPMIWIGALADVLLFAILLQSGVAVGAAQITSFFTGLLAACLVWRRASIPAEVNRAVIGAHLVIVCLLAVFLRDGVMALVVDSWKGSPYFAILAAVAASMLVVWQGIATLPLYSPATSGEARWFGIGMRLLGYLFALRLLYLGQTELLPEESYYWNYSKHLDIGYLDHPPMVAWLIYAGTAFFGDSEFGVRIGALGSWIIAAAFSYRLAREMFDKATAAIVLLLLLVLPFFFSSGFFMTPDAPLTAAWAGVLFYLYRALVLQRSKAWFGVGICMGLGMVSKYSIALLGLAALVFILLDRPSRQWLTRWGPYGSSLIALAIFSPVIVWNAKNQWASFAYQTTNRIAAAPSFSFHELIGSAVVLLTPLGLCAAALVFFKSNQADSRKRQLLYVRIFTLLPLLVFVVFSMRHQVKLVWTGPLWLALLPEIAYRIRRMKSDEPMGLILRKGWAATAVGMAIFYGVALHYLTMGLPGVGYSRQMQLFPVGWRDLGRQIDSIEDRLEEKIGEEPVIVGMDRNFIASQLAFYDPDEDEPVDAVAGPHLFGKNSLMYARWSPPEMQKNRTLVMVAWNSKDLEGRRISSRVKWMDAIKEGTVTRNGKFICRFYYRFAYGYHSLPPLIR